jgi:hypothetical protein
MVNYIPVWEGNEQEIRLYLHPKKLGGKMIDLRSTEPSNHPMYDRDIFPPNIIHYNLPNLRILPSVPKKQ